MPNYRVTIGGKPDVFSITHHRPEGGATPKTEGWMQYIPGVGFEVTMRCFEKDPLAVYTQPDDPVFHDSCMEVFLKCFPQSPDYINVEMNANGAMRCGFGPGRNRAKVLELGFPQPEVSVTREADFWLVRCLISEKLLESLYQRPCRFAPGDEMRGNFYKCAEKTAIPHWASWSKVERLDFHTPEFFGMLKIEEGEK